MGMHFTNVQTAFSTRRNTVLMDSSLINSTMYATGPTMSSVTTVIMARAAMIIVKVEFTQMKTVLVSISAQMGSNIPNNSVQMDFYSMVKYAIGHKMSAVMRLSICKLII